jgi:hypothetical protein
MSRLPDEVVDIAAAVGSGYCPAVETGDAVAVLVADR